MERIAHSNGDGDIHADTHLGAVGVDVAAPRPLLRATGVTKHFPVKTKGFGLQRTRTLRAVDNVDLDIPRGTTVGLVGESGSGKSTLGRMITRLTDVTAGEIELDGIDIAHIRGSQLRQLRRRVQMVFQDPYSSFDPSSAMVATVLEPVDAFERLSGKVRRARVQELFELVGLNPTLVDRYPRQLSGGQLQRAAVARALSTNPDLVVLDEPVSALDVSTQAQVVNLLADLQERVLASYLFIGHDLSVVRHVSSRIAVMYLGRIVEEGPTDQVYRSPAHPYTAALLSAVPVPDPTRQRARTRLELRGEIPSPLDPPSGCHFRTRCQWAMPICAAETPAEFVTPGGVRTYCHLHTSGPELMGASVTTLQSTTAATN
ncbi:MAG: ABC transporter ATP-binding protein [Microbacteriaceae bacterium]